MAGVPPGSAATRSRILTLVFTDLRDSMGLKTSRGDLLAGDVILPWEGSGPHRRAPGG